MVDKEDLLGRLERVYKETKSKEGEELHNAIVEVINKQQPSLENAYFILELIKFSLMESKYKEILGTVKLTNKLPLKKIGG